MILKKISKKKSEKVVVFSIGKSIFQVNFLLEKIDFPIGKKTFFQKNVRVFFKIIFRWDFFLSSSPGRGESIRSGFRVILTV